MIGWIGGIILGGVLVIATFGKVAAPIVFVEQIRNENLDFLFSANVIALLALAAEMWLGVDISADDVENKDAALARQMREWEGEDMRLHDVRRAVEIFGGKAAP